MTITQPPARRVWIPLGRTYFAIVDQAGDHLPVGMIAASNTPELWEQFAFNRSSREWSADPWVALPLLAPMSKANDLFRAVPITEREATVLLRHWGGDLLDWDRYAGFYSDDQPRADDGKWTSGGGGGGAATKEKKPAGEKAHTDRDEGRVKGSAPEETIQMIRDTPREGSPTGRGTRNDPIAVGGDLDRALQLIAEGKHVRLDQPDQVSTMLDKLVKITDDARAKGAKAPHYDLGKVTVKGTNLFTQESQGIERVNMPQFKGEVVPGSPAAKDAVNGRADISDSFLHSLRDAGVKVTGSTVSASHLRATQLDLDGAKVAGMARAMQQGTMPDEAIYISRDNYVIDGHHRWAAKIGVDAGDNKLGTVKQRVLRIDMDIGGILSVSRDYAAQMGIKQAAVFSGSLLDLFMAAVKAGFVRRQDHVPFFVWGGDGGGGGNEEGSWATLPDGRRIFITPKGAPRGDLRSPATVKTATRIYEKHKELELSVTPIMQQLASQMGGTLEGFEYRIKTPDSIARKIDNYAHEMKQSPDTVADRVQDALRYTIAVPEQDLVSTVRGAERSFNRLGLETVALDNFWPRGDSYNGINANYRDPKTGAVFELQYHTPESFRVKEFVNHKDYEFARDKGNPVEARRAAFYRMTAAADALPIPPNVMSVGTLRSKPFKE